VLWDPDLALALRNVKGAHVVYSTKTATNLIFDVMVCDSRLLAKPEGQAVVQKFVAGWMEGVQAARSQPRQRRGSAGQNAGILQAAG
jgi:NitT/TauT family transport system substrate-binding protein